MSDPRTDSILESAMTYPRIDKVLSRSYKQRRDRINAPFCGRRKIENRSYKQKRTCHQQWRRMRCVNTGSRHSQHLKQIYGIVDMCVTTKFENDTWVILR